MQGRTRSWAEEGEGTKGRAEREGESAGCLAAAAAAGAGSGDVDWLLDVSGTGTDGDDEGAASDERGWCCSLERLGKAGGSCCAAASERCALVSKASSFCRVACSGMVTTKCS
eukprot:scaffold112202_cov19-Tisochrysis_lutea.AAC.1